MRSHVLWEDISYERLFLQEDMSYSKTYHKPRNALHDDIGF